MTVARSIAAVACLAAAVLIAWSYTGTASAGLLRTAGIVTLTIGLLATVALPEFLTALIFFFLCVVLAVAPPEVVFSGFYSGAIWLVFGGLMIGAAIDVTGLGERVAGVLERRFADSYFKAVLGTVLLMLVLAFLMPSSLGRITIMLPIVMALADRLGFAPGSNGRAGLILAVALGSITPTFAILPACVPNVVLAGAAEAIHSIQFAYSDYLLIHFPVIGVLGTMALPVFICLLFRDRVQPQESAGEQSAMSSSEKRLIGFLLIALCLWVTDTVHGIAPAWVALGTGIVCTLPVVGVMKPVTVMEKVSFGPILFLAAFVGMGAVITHAGLGEALGGWLIERLEFSKETRFSDFASMIGLGVLLQLVTTLPGQPAIMTSFAETLAGATGWPLMTVLMTSVSGWALVMFPYQAPPLVATRALTGLSVGSFIRLMLPLALFGWIVMVPLQFFWWRALGLFS